MTDVATLRARLSELRGLGLDAVDEVEEAAWLAADLQRLANTGTSETERRQAEQLSRLMEDESGRVFTTALTDQAFRPKSAGRMADQLVHLMDRYGIPRYFSTWERLQLGAFRAVGRLAPSLSVPAVKDRIREEMGTVVVPGEEEALTAYLAARAAEGVRVNLNTLGEAILGEDDAVARLERYVEAVSRPDVGCISVKISSIASQLEPLAWEATLEVLAERLRRLYRAAMATPWRQPDGSEAPKLVYLDMEEHGDLDLTVALFQQVLDEPEFRDTTAGIVLQGYLPDSHEVQRDITAWAQRRVAAGGRPIRVRLVKGANLRMERLHAVLHGWPQAPYTTKADVDASYKRMVVWGATPERVAAVRLGIASHNVFDIAYAMVVREATGTAGAIGFEMLEGMADPLRRVVQDVADDVLVYGPAVKAEEIQSAIAYLIRRLDENTDPENFLRHSFGLEPGSETWIDQEGRFRDACARRDTVYEGPRRRQDRREPPQHLPRDAAFANEPDTDWSLHANRAWIHERLAARAGATREHVPLQIGGALLLDGGADRGQGDDPSRPGEVAYTYARADLARVDQALDCARAALEPWSSRPLAERSEILASVARSMRERRGEILAVMVGDGGKAIRQADPEISEAIDFAEYYWRSAEALAAHADVEATPRGVVLVTPPWNFPFAIPAGGVLAALAAGNTVILKPAPQTVLTAWHLARLLWDAGVPMEALQLVCCEDDPVGSALVKDPRVDVVILTGGTSTARLFHRMRPELPLLAETGGKNALVITALADVDLAIAVAVYSAFGHSGQKCSATSLLVAEAEVHDDPSFRRRLVDAAASLGVGSAWDPRSVVTPLIHPPAGALARGLAELDDGESWWLEPRPDPDNPCLWSPGIKGGVAEGSWSHQTELFGPVLSVLRADDLEHALRIANGTPYGLTAGLCTLDDREEQTWLGAMDAGNLYVNRATTGAIVQRQPFGGRKGSCFGPGAKAGGPDYVAQLARLRQVGVPADLQAPTNEVTDALVALAPLIPDEASVALVQRSAESYAWAQAHHFSVGHDPSLIPGQDNLLVYHPLGDELVLRLGPDWHPTAACQVLVAALTVGGWRLAISLADPDSAPPGWTDATARWPVRIETDEALAARLLPHGIRRLRVLGAVGPALREAANELGIHLDAEPPLANGRLELVRYHRTQSRSIDYHRYGNLGDRRHEERAAVL